LARASLLLAAILILLPGLAAQAYVSTWVPHDWVYSDYEPCAMCHPMLYDPDAAVWDVWYQYRDSTPEFASYRCAACHIGLNTTRDLTAAHAASTHQGLACTMCHDVYHSGHLFRGGYYHEYPSVEVYGCSDTRGCHQVSGNWAGDARVRYDETPYNFAPAYHVNSTGTKSWVLSRIVYGYGTRYFMGIYPEAFINPLNGSLDSVPQDRPDRMCHKCHYTAPTNPPTTPQNYTSTHPDTCTQCHSTAGDPHTAAPAGQSWQQCSTCHTTIAGNVAAGPHDRVACRCHDVVHAAGWDRAGAWTVHYQPGERLLTGDPGALAEWRHVIYYSPANSSILGVPQGRVATGTGETYVYIAYTLGGDAGIVNRTSRMTTCFNCHFTATGQAGGSPLAIQAGLADPHTLTHLDQPVPLEAGGGHRGRNAAILGLAVILAITALAGARKK